MSTSLCLLLLSAIVCLAYGLRCQLQTQTENRNMICKEGQNFCIIKMFKDGVVERYCDGYQRQQQFCMSAGTWRVENGEMFCCMTDYCNTNTSTVMTKATPINSSAKKTVSALFVLLVTAFIA
ncbi:hypothetical protein QR680_018141 [Steinernema hermaphroditum]|uniref:UPAR/Ly6 domain-containing protein n=1 Tax=Steinernema hermaphroditum TaxID=289476 RepID=A0AA39LQ92_9BILA|nr:hypothetical protein QR680_018141 [Steinernema hermaphroditum]